MNREDADFGTGFVRPPEPRDPALDSSVGEPTVVRSDSPGRSGSNSPPRPTGVRPTGMLLATVGVLEGFKVVTHFGMVDGDTILGANVLRDFFASVRDVVGGRVNGYEKVLANAKREAVEIMVEKARKKGANAIIGVDIDYEIISVENGGAIMMVMTTGTAVLIESVPN